MMKKNKLSLTFVKPEGWSAPLFACLYRNMVQLLVLIRPPTLMHVSSLISGRHGLAHLMCYVCLQLCAMAAQSVTL